VIVMLPLPLVPLAARSLPHISQLEKSSCLGCAESSRGGLQVEAVGGTERKGGLFLCPSVNVNSGNRDGDRRQCVCSMSCCNRR
jgi:hypothetical protein